MYKIYRIDTIPSETNAYKTGRMETWTMRLDTTFNNLEDAKEYVRSQNLKLSELSHLLVDIKDELERDYVVDSFCFSDKYLHLRRYFLGLPDYKKIIEAIRDQGIRVI